MKRILILLAVVVVLAMAAAAWFVYSRLDSIVASAIESYGSQATGTAVRVRSVSLDLREGRGTIRGLRVANPDGFRGGEAFRLGEISLALEVASLTKTPIVVRELSVSAPEADFVLDAGGRSNFQVIKSNLERYSGSEPSSESSGPPIRIRIERFAFEQGRVEADFSALDPKREPLTAELPPLRMRDIGGASGASPGEIGKTIGVAFSAAVARTVAANQAGKAVEKALSDKIGSEGGAAAGQLLKKVLE